MDSEASLNSVSSSFSKHLYSSGSKTLTEHEINATLQSNLDSQEHKKTNAEILDCILNANAEKEGVISLRTKKVYDIDIAFTVEKMKNLNCKWLKF